jgi:hypothetical protein
VTTISVTPWPLSVFEQAHDFLAGGAVEVAGRLVGENHRRLHDRGAGDGHALALPAGELVRAMVGAVLQAVVAQRLRHPLGTLRRRDAGERHRQGDVLGGGQARHQMEALEDETDALAAYPRLLFGRKRGDVAALEAVGAGIGAVEQAEQVEQRRFARAGRAHHRHVLAGGDASGQGVRSACTSLSPSWKTRSMPASSISGALILSALRPSLPAAWPLPSTWA